MKGDIKFLLICKRNNLRPTFARPKITVKLDTKLRKKITQSIIEAEITNKHKRLKDLKKEAKEDLQKLRATLDFAFLCALNRTINRRIIGMRLKWNRIHERKLAQTLKRKR